jgi:hypothetical protein
MRTTVHDPRPYLEESADSSLVRKNRFIQRMLDDRDRQVASLQEELSTMRRDWAWRTLGFLRLGFGRIRSRFWRTAMEDADERRSCRQAGVRVADR